MEKTIELLHDSCLHDLPEEESLLLQLLGTKVLPMAGGPLVIVEEVDESCVGRLGEQLLVDVSEKPAASGWRPIRRPEHAVDTLPESCKQARGST